MYFSDSGIGGELFLRLTRDDLFPDFISSKQVWDIILVSPKLELFCMVSVDRGERTGMVIIITCIQSYWSNPDRILHLIL